MKQRHVAAPLAANETDRLARLALLRVVDSEAEPFFDALAAAAQAIAGTPIALVSLVDEHRQWWKAKRRPAGRVADPARAGVLRACHPR